jgi:hypothetical protein
MKYRLPTSEFELVTLIESVANTAAVKALCKAGVLKPFVSKREAYDLHGRGKVDFWIKAGLIKLIKDGENTSNLRLDRAKLEAVAQTSNRCEYFDLYYSQK